MQTCGIGEEDLHPYARVHQLFFLVSPNSNLIFMDVVGEGGVGGNDGEVVIGRASIRIRLPSELDRYLIALDGAYGEAGRVGYLLA
jgi:hypothetical protein